MENTLKIIKNQYGVNLLSDPEKVLSYFADLKPGDTKTLRRLKFFFQSGAAGITSSNIGSPEIAFQKAVAKYNSFSLFRYITEECFYSLVYEKIP